MRRVVFGVWRLTLRQKARSSATALDPTRVIWLRPGDICGAVWKERTPAFAQLRLRDHIGKVLGGDWDRDAIAPEDLAVLDAFDQRINHGAAWSDTEYYHSIVRGVQEGNRHFGCDDIDDVNERFARFDALWRAVAKDGYKSQADLNTGRPWDEIMVVIDRNGRFLLIDGRHRWATAAALGVPKVPAIVVARHKEWHDFVLEIHANAAANNGRTYQPLLHPDLEHVSSAHDHERFDVIRANLPVDRGRVLDIGANWGYFSHRLEELGFTCIAVERSEREFYFLDRLRRAQNRNFVAVRGSIFEVDLPPSFDVVLAINIFHHFLKTQGAYDRLCAFLARLDTQHMFLQTHLPHEGQMRDAYRNLEPLAFVDLVANTAGLPAVKDLGHTTDGRSMYLLSR